MSTLSELKSKIIEIYINKYNFILKNTKQYIIAYN